MDERTDKQTKVPLFYKTSSPSGPLPKNSWRTKIVKGAKILGSLAKSEASGIKIGPLRKGMGLWGQYQDIWGQAWWLWGQDLWL